MHVSFTTMAEFLKRVTIVHHCIFCERPLSTPQKPRHHLLSIHGCNVPLKIGAGRRTSNSNFTYLDTSESRDLIQKHFGCPLCRFHHDTLASLHTHCFSLHPEILSITEIQQPTQDPQCGRRNEWSTVNTHPRTSLWKQQTNKRSLGSVSPEHPDAKRRQPRHSTRSQYQQTTKLDDIFAGSNYKSMASQIFPNELGIAFSLFKNENMIQVLVMPGPNSAKGDGFWSFLQPLLDEFQTRTTAGISVVCDNGNLVTVKAHMLMAIGDLPAVSTMAGHSGHDSYFGCHICPIRGQIGPTRHGMYFPPSNYDAALSWRSSTDFNCNPQDLLWNAPFKGTPLASLKSFNGPVTFVLDGLHLLDHGLCKQVLDLIKGNATKEGDLFLVSAKVKDLFVDIENSRCGVPASFDGSFRTPHSKHTTSAVDYLACYDLVKVGTWSKSELIKDKVLNKLRKEKHNSGVGTFLQGCTGWTSYGWYSWDSSCWTDNRILLGNIAFRRCVRDAGIDENQGT
ncbi:hypothetical protein [Absidia glauca]|uniref:Uncharacterized protein n=1 Tax=Absidia glauca TaxID=4829 RepID=A0A163JIY6_ABSGL|nr:hypothetical protein [Absidia glauca]